MSPEASCSLLDPAALLRAGAEAFIVLHKDALRERIDVRQTRVLDWEGDVLFLAQTDPPVPREASGAQVEVVALAPACGEELRPMGYVARVLDVRPDYPGGGLSQPGGGLSVEAIAVSAPAAGDLFETSLRMHYRVPVEEDMGVGILLEGFETPQLLDFSAGGARVRVEASEQAYADLTVGKSIPFRLLFVGSGYAAGDAVVRSLRREDDRVTCGLFFTNMEIRDIRYLERMVARVVSACRQRESDAGYV